jgi:hypothetical protein
VLLVLALATGVQLSRSLSNTITVTLQYHNRDSLIPELFFCNTTTVTLQYPKRNRSYMEVGEDTVVVAVGSYAKHESVPDIHDAMHFTPRGLPLSCTATALVHTHTHTRTHAHTHAHTHIRTYTYTHTHTHTHIHAYTQSDPSIRSLGKDQHTATYFVRCPAHCVPLQVHTLSAVCRLPSAVCCLLSAVCCLLSANCCLLHTSCAARQTVFTFRRLCTRVGPMMQRAACVWPPYTTATPL